MDAKASSAAHTAANTVVPLAQKAEGLDTSKIDAHSTLSLAAKLCETTPDACANAARALTSGITSDLITGLIGSSDKPAVEKPAVEKKPPEKPAVKDAAPAPRPAAPAKTQTAKPEAAKPETNKLEANKLGALMEAAATPPRREAAKPGAAKVN